MKIGLTVLICFISLGMTSQNKATVEKSIFGLQTGFLGLWVHNEYKISDKIALRSEFGLDAGLSGGGAYNSVNYLLAPSLSLEPRFYYNLNKRVKKGRSISKNSGNFITVRLNYFPDWFVISSVDNISVVENFAVIPKWAIKRTVGSHFTYEAGIGIGYRYYFLKKYNLSSSNNGETILDLHLRIGYSL